MRTWLAQRRYRWVLAGAAVAAVVAGVSVALAVAHPDAQGDAAPSVTAEVQQVTASGDAPSHTLTVDPELAPGAAILTSLVDTLEVFDAPGGTVSQRLSRHTYYASTLTLMASDTTDVDGATWYQVSLPAKPNGQEGWVRASDVSVSSTDTIIHVYLAEHELDIEVGDNVVATIPVAVGADATPTPIGTFYVTDPLDFTANTASAYGAFALGLSGYSDVLDSFNGGPPQIALHGTNQPQYIGQSVSNGCIRMTNEAVLDLASRVGLGTPVIISAARDAS